jgi:hypothetical protein
LSSIRRIDQHQRAARRRGQQLDDAIETIAFEEHGTPAGIAEIVAQYVDFGGMQLEQAHAILFAHLPPCEIGRAGIKLQRAVRIQRLDLFVT